MRLDEKLLELEYVTNIEKARDLILAGAVLVNSTTVRDKKYKVLDADVVTFNNNNMHVSRGYDKLEHAIKTFDLNVENEIALDIGSSTGGFTQCLIDYGVLKVYALDVGHNQLVYKLRKDKKVISIENTNAKDIKSSMFEPSPTIIVSDVSFISLSKIAPVIKKELSDIKFWVALIKPQFEAERNEVGDGGIIRDDNLREEICKRAIEKIEKEGFSLKNKTTSPIKGQKGNIEYLALFTHL